MYGDFIELANILAKLTTVVRKMLKIGIIGEIFSHNTFSRPKVLFSRKSL